MTDKHISGVPEILRRLLDDASPATIDLARSMEAVQDLAGLVLDKLEHVDVIAAESNENDVILGYEVARRIGAERTVLHQDAGLLTLDGAGLDGAHVAAVTLLPLPTERVEALRLMVERAGGSLVTAASALSPSDVDALRRNRA